MRKMQEFLLWSNCTNKCAFCWQCKKADKMTYLNEQEMLDCIDSACAMLDTIDYDDDVLLVGGEILAPYYKSVNQKLHNLLDKCVAMLNKGVIRYLYINTNLIYTDRVNLTYLLEKTKGYEDKLKFTTSYDIYGRFTEQSKKIFFDNLAYIHNNYPKVNIVVNSIITRQLVDTDFDFDAFKNDYGIRYINFIPYVPVEDDRSMDVTFRDIIKVLSRKRVKGYIDFYINDLDLHQNKALYEYRKDKGFVECTSEYSSCGHNENFKKVLNGECYICKLKEVFR